jgi:hypothetical protein
MTHGAEVRLGCHVQNLDVDKGKNDNESDGQQRDQQEMSFTPVEEIFDRHGNHLLNEIFPDGGCRRDEFSRASQTIWENTQTSGLMQQKTVKTRCLGKC